MLSAKRPVVATPQVNTPAFFEERNTPASLPAPMLNTPGPVTSLDTRVLTGGLLNSPEGSAQSREPVVIKGVMKRPEPLPPHSLEARWKHRKRLWVLGMLMLVTTIAATLFITTPQGHEITSKFGANPTSDSGSLITSQQNVSAAKVSAQATATYMYQNDGFDPYSHGEVNVSDGKNSLPWPYGQCTYWANYEYHKETGYWVQWTGNADQWFQGAQEAGWDYSQTPPVGIPSIIVLMPYVQGAGWLGHVAVVEGQSGNVVHTSNMNWGFGGSTHVEYVDFTIGSGVYFVWHRPAS